MKRCFIIRPGRIGDIVIVLPIAKYYADKGYKVYWFIYHEFSTMLKYVDYVCPIPLFCNDIYSGAAKAYRELNKIDITQTDIVIDISIGFTSSKVHGEWINTNLPFDVWKYKKAGVPFSEKWNLKINRKRKKEKILSNYMGIRPGDIYSVTHSISAMGSFCFDTIISKYQNKRIHLVEIKKVEGFTIFDWIGIIEQSQWVYCVDSCAANLVNQLGFCKNRRVFKFLRDNRKIYQPTMKDDWIIL